MNAGLPSKVLTCHCCEFSTGFPYRHCPSCHSVAMHGVSDFSYRAIVLGVCAYEGTDQTEAVAAAQAGGGYVTISPILVDFREQLDDDAFRPEFRTRYGSVVVPLDAVRIERHLDGGCLPQRRVTAGVADGNGVRLVDMTCAETHPGEHPSGPETPRHAEGISQDVWARRVR